MRTLLIALALAAGTAPVARLDPDPWPRPPTSSADVRRGIAAAVESGDKGGVTRGMFRLAQMGGSLSAETQARLAPMIDPDALPRGWTGPLSPAERFASAFGYNAFPNEASERFAAVPAEHRLIEGVAWDEATGRLFAGSVIDRRVLVLDGGAWREAPLAGPAGGVFGMAVDPPRRLLWLASAAADPMPDPATAFSGLIAIDLDRLVEVRRVPVPGARLGDVALAADGTVYASDGRSGAILRCRPGCTAAEMLIPPGIFRSPQGMALDLRGRLLHVADYAMGLLRVDLDSLAVRPVVVRAPQMLDGIDGLVRIGRHLVAVQNGTLPRRIVRIDLSRDGRIVENVTVIEQNVALWGEPTLGTVRGEGLLYVADGQWERFGAGGVLVDGAPPRATSIRWIGSFADIVVTRRAPDPLPAAPSLASLRPGS